MPIDHDAIEKYDVAFSFAGAQRDYVKKVKEALKEYSVSVFYDNDHQADLWGKNLFRYLDELYSEHATYCVVFVSKEYKERTWTIHESQAAQERMLFEYNDRTFQEYILPVRFDDTDIPGIRRTTGYIDAREVSPEELAYLIVQKLHKNIPCINDTNENISMLYAKIVNLIQKKINESGEYCFYTEKDYFRIGVVQAGSEKTIATFRLVSDLIQFYLNDEILENPVAIIFINRETPNKPLKIINRFCLSADFIEKNMTVKQLVNFLCTEVENNVR